jgi:geranylgeranyl diphosphate synthase type I
VAQVAGELAAALARENGLLHRPLSASLSSFFGILESELARVLSRSGDASRLPEECEVLLDELRVTVDSGGKRLRPIFCLLGYLAGGGRLPGAITRPAAAMELLHTAALVQDDVFDRARIRRAIPTLHVRLRGRLGCDALSAEAAATLAANLAVTLAEDLLLSAPFSSERLLEAQRLFTRMRAEMVAGELNDVISTSFDEAGARRTAQLKCASYTVVGPLLVGAHLAGAQGGLLASLTQYGRLVGEAFQLRNDLSGLRTTASEELSEDIRIGKRTLVASIAFRVGSEPVRHLLVNVYGSASASRDDVEALRRAFLDSGAVRDAEALIARLVAEATTLLDSVRIEPYVRAALQQLACRCAADSDRPLCLVKEGEDDGAA